MRVYTYLQDNPGRTYGHTEQGAYPNVPTMIKASTLHNSKM